MHCYCIADTINTLLLSLHFPILLQEEITPLHYAAVRGHTETVMELVRLGAKVDMQTKVKLVS